MTTNLAALNALISGRVSAYQGNSGDIARCADGKNTFRLISDGEWIDPNNPVFWVDYGAHWIKAVKNGKPLAVVGNSEIFDGTPSAVSMAIEQAIESASDAASKELYESWRAAKRVLVNVVDRKDEAVKVLELTSTTWGKILEIITFYAQNGHNILDPMTGLDVVINKTGTGLNTEYTVMVMPTAAKPLTKDQIAKATDLREFVKRKFFKGEEPKALAAIGQITGLSFTGLPAPSAPSLSLPSGFSAPGTAAPAANLGNAPALASEAARVTTPAPAAAPTPAAGLSEVEALRAQLAALEASTAAATQPATDPASSGDVIDEEAILRELSALQG